MPPAAEYVTIARSRGSATALLAAGVLLFVLAASERPFARWEPVHLLALSACVLGTWFLIRPRPGKVVVWDDGFTVISGQSPPERFLWSDVGSVQWDSDKTGVECLDTERRVVVRLETTFFGTRARADRFRQYAASHIARAAINPVE